MNKNILSILIIRVNLVFRVSLTLFVDSSLLDNIMNPVWKRGKRSIEKSYKEQKPEQSSDLNHNYSLFVVSKQKNETNEDEYATSWWCLDSQHQISKVPDWSPKVWEVCCSESFSYSNETDEESE